MASQNPAREPSKRPRIRSQRLQDSEDSPRARTGKGKSSRTRGGSSRTEERGKEPAMEDIPMESQFQPYFSEEHLMMDFTTFGASKELVPPRFVKMSWLRNFNGFIATELERQGLSQLLEMTGIYYPNLIRAFYTALSRESTNQDFAASLKGTQVILSDDLWFDIVGLRDTASGFVANKASLLHRGMPFNKIEVYRSMMKDPAERIAGNRLSVKPLKLEFRVLHYILTWIILPRGSNHAQVFEDDLIVLWAIRNRWKINWIHMIKDTMLKARRLNDSALPYGVLVSKFLMRYNVPVDDEGYDQTKAESELQNRHIKQMGYEQVNGTWTEKRRGSDATGLQEPPIVLGDEDEATAEFESSERPLSAFEQQVMNRLDNLTTGQIELREHQVAMRQYQVEIRQSQDVLMQGQEDLRAYLHNMSDRLDAWGVPRKDD